MSTRYEYVSIYDKHNNYIYAFDLEIKEYEMMANIYTIRFLGESEFFRLFATVFIEWDGCRDICFNINENGSASFHWCNDKGMKRDLDTLQMVSDFASYFIPEWIKNND